MADSHSISPETLARYPKGWDPAEHYKDPSVASDYDRTRFVSPAGRLFSAIEKRGIRRAFAALPRGARIADVPCGTGRLAEALLEAGYAVEGIDISPAMLQVASARLARFGSRFTTRVADARQLEAAGLAYDGVLCARVLMHFPYDEQVAFLRNVAAVSRGPVVFTQGIVTRWHRLRRAVKRRLPTANPASFALTPAEARTIAADAGLELVANRAMLPILSESRIFIARRPPGRAA